MKKVKLTAAAALTFMGLSEATLNTANAADQEKPGASMAEMISSSKELETNIIKKTNEKGRPGRINGIEAKTLVTDQGKATVLLDKSGLPRDMILELKDGERLIFYYDGGAKGRPDKRLDDNQKSSLRNSPNKRSAEGTLEVLTPFEQTKKTVATEAGLSPKPVRVMNFNRDAEGNIQSIETADFEDGKVGQVGGEDEIGAIETSITDQQYQEGFRDDLRKFEKDL